MWFERIKTDSNKQIRNLSCIRKMPALFALVSVLALSACSFGGSTNQNAQQVASPYDPVKRVEKEQDNVNAPSSAIDTMKEFMPPSGLNTKRLFAERIDKAEPRFQRLEHAVQKMRDDIDTVSPAIVRLVAVEQDIKDLVKQLEDLAREEKQSQTYGGLPADARKVPPIKHLQDNQNAMIEPHGKVQTEPASSSAPLSLTPNKAAKKQTEKTSVPAEMKLQKMQETSKQPEHFYNNVKKLRIGEHDDKTRIVIELDQAPKTDITVSADKRSATVTFKGTSWKAKKSFVSQYAPLVKKYNVTTQNGESVLKMEFRYPVESFKSLILAKSGKDAHRLVLDAYSPDVHW